MAAGEGSSHGNQDKGKHGTNQPLTDPSNAEKLTVRRRVWRACESCRRKKIKCDGVEPTCSQCTTSGSQCNWLQTKDRAALSRHYVQELEARLLHMENLFTQVAPVLEQMGQTPNGISIQPRSDTSTPSAANFRPIAPRQSPLPTNNRAGGPIKIEEDVSDIFGQLALDEYGHMRWIGGSSTMSLIQSFRNITSSPLHRISPMEEDPLAPGPSVNKLYFPASVFFGKVRALPGPEEVEYPPRDLADKLVEAYFARFHFLMPIIDKPSFLKQYVHIMESIHDQVTARNETAFISLVFAVFACAVPLIDDPRLNISDRLDDGGMGMVYYERALILQYISHARIQPAHVQCFTLLSSYLCSVNCLPQAWILIGQAVRTAQDLGLHRSPKRLAITPIEKETRRKTWWGVYTLDRMLALALGRPLGVNDNDCDVELPVDVDDQDLTEYFSGATLQSKQPLMNGFILLIQLYEIAGRVQREVYALDKCRDNLEPEKKAELHATVESLDGELTKWCDDLPEVYKSASQTNEQVSMGAVLWGHCYSVLTSLHRNLVPVKKGQPLTPKSTAKAVSSARSCIRLAPSMKNVVPPSHHLAFFIQHLFSSAVILLLYAMHCGDDRAAAAAMDEARSTLSAIESWEGQWPGARKCKELLVELTETASAAIARGSAATVSDSNEASANTSQGRRRSISIVTPTANAVSNRAIKGRTSRRNPSRDPGAPSSRRMAAVSPYRVPDGSRARSASRRRGHDDNEVNAPLSPYYQSFPSPPSQVRATHSASSSHSSPASGTMSSPAATQVSPRAPTFSLGSPTTQPNTLSSPTNATFDYDFANIAQGSSMSGQWDNSGMDSGGDNMNIYNDNNYGNSFGMDDQHSSAYPSARLDSLYPGFNGFTSTSDAGGGFTAPGLPFRGLDFIKNYNTNEPANYSITDPDLWQQGYDPTSFEYGPDVPFSLGDVNLTDDSNSNAH